MNKTMVAAAVALTIGAPALAKDYNFTVTNMMPEGTLMAPMIIVDATKAEPIMFENGKMSELYVNTVLEGDPRPMGSKLGAAVAGPVLGKSGPPEVMIAGGETATTDLFIESTVLRFYAKTGYAPGSDTWVTGVWDVATGGGTLMLNTYDLGQSEGTNEITLVKEGTVKVEIKAN